MCDTTQASLNNLWTNDLGGIDELNSRELFNLVLKYVPNESELPRRERFHNLYGFYKYLSREIKSVFSDSNQHDKPDN